MTDSVEMIVAKTLKRLYPNNPDDALEREARVIVAELKVAGVQFMTPIVDCTKTPGGCDLSDGHEGACVTW